MIISMLGGRLSIAFSGCAEPFTTVQPTNISTTHNLNVVILVRVILLVYFIAIYSWLLSLHYLPFFWRIGIWYHADFLRPSIIIAHHIYQDIRSFICQVPCFSTIGFDIVKLPRF